MAKKYRNMTHIGGGMYAFTPGRRAALTKAQRISAQKRSRNRKIVAGVAITAAAVAGGVYLHKKGLFVGPSTGQPRIIDSNGRAVRVTRLGPNRVRITAPPGTRNMRVNFKDHLTNAEHSMNFGSAESKVGSMFTPKAGSVGKGKIYGAGARVAVDHANTEVFLGKLAEADKWLEGKILTPGLLAEHEARIQKIYKTHGMWDFK